MLLVERKRSWVHPFRSMTFRMFPKTFDDNENKHAVKSYLKTFLKINSFPLPYFQNKKNTPSGPSCLITVGANVVFVRKLLVYVL